MVVKFKSNTGGSSRFKTVSSKLCSNATLRASRTYTLSFTPLCHKTSRCSSSNYPFHCQNNILSRSKLAIFQVTISNRRRRSLVSEDEAEVGCICILTGKTNLRLTYLTVQVLINGGKLFLTNYIYRW